jgi:acyl-homoserine lactone acylase PvdQ
LKTGVLSPLPRVTEQRRRQLLKEIDEKGPFESTRAAIAELEQSNPELLQAVHHFASGLGHYLQAMQGFAPLHRALIVQPRLDRARPH